MKRRVSPWMVNALFAIACSSGETPGNDAHGGSAGTTNTAGTLGVAGTHAGTGGTASSAGGTAGTTPASSGSAGAITAGGGTGASSGVGGVGGGAGTSQGGVGPRAGSGGMPAAGTPAAGGGAGGAGAAGAAGSPAAGTGAGGAGAGGTPSGGMGGGPGSTASYTCNQVVGIDSTGEWFTSGFENQVPNGKWQIVYHHPGYVEDWADANDAVWGLTPTSACTTNSDNPDRVIFNIYSETLTDKNSLVTAINKAVTNFKNKYSRLKRVDILTMTRSPDNMPCQSGQNGAVVQKYVDDAVAAVVSAGPPAVVASPQFHANDCSIFQDGGPHFTDAGKPVAAKIYGDYYSTEP